MFSFNRNVVVYISWMRWWEYQSQSGESADEGPQGEPIKIGYIGALTNSIVGQAGLNGMLLAEQDINDAGGILGRPVKLYHMTGRVNPRLGECFEQTNRSR